METKILLAPLLWALTLLSYCYGQPVASSKQQIGGLDVYQDFKNEKLFYYAPGKLNLAFESNGSPRFQMIQMRYTGTGVYGDRGENRFLNIVQFTVLMDRITSEQLAVVSEHLGRRADLRPLPIRDIEAVLVAPLSGVNGSAYKKVGKNGSFQSDNKNGSSGKEGFWTERTFTVKLENHEAQILWDQIENGQLALSLSYSFFSDMIPGNQGDYAMTADSTMVDLELADSKLFNDTTISRSIVRGDAFPIRVNVQEWPDLIRKIDVNEGIPPAYAALEVTCYDFTNSLRPDLALKSIDIEATGVGGQPVLLTAKKFTSHEPDLNALQIKFPYAVKLSTPFRYRITEYTVEGTREVSAWKTADSWVTSLDITTAEAARKFQQKTVEVETPLLSEHGVSKVKLYLFYTFREKIFTMPLEFESTDSPQVKPLSITYDKDSKLWYKVIWTQEDGKKETKLAQLNAIDDYLYLLPPE